MLKRLPSRSQRSRGIKAKSVIQILLLLGICFWLIYQVKYSHDKKRELNEQDGNAVSKHPNLDISKYGGRKELHPRVEETDKKDDSREEKENVIDEEDVRQEGLEEDLKVQDVLQGNKAGSSEHDSGEEQEEAEHEEAEQELKKHEDEEEQEEEEHRNDEMEDEGQGGEDAEMDEHDQERLQGEADGEEERIDEDKEREEEGDDKESENNDEEDQEGQVDDERDLEDGDHDEGKSAHEAREENYKGDDASSAVAHDNQISIDTEKLILDNLNENLGINTTGEERNPNADKNNLEVNIKEDGMVEIGSNPNKTGNLSKDPKLSTAPVNGSVDLIRTSANETLSQLGTRINSTEVDTGASNNTGGGSSEFSIAPILNATETMDPLQAQNTTADGVGAGEISGVKILNVDLGNDSNMFTNDLIPTTSTAEVGRSSDLSNSSMALAEKIASSNEKETAENNIKLPSRLNETDGVTRVEVLKSENGTGSSQTA